MYEGKEEDKTEFCFKYLLTTEGKLLGSCAMGEQTLTCKKFCGVSKPLAALCI